MSSIISFLVGNSRRVKFWKDKWCGDKPLCVSFLPLFAIVVSKDVWVVDVWNSTVDKGGWVPRFSRSINDWKVESV